MSSSMALRRSPKPGALTAHTLRTPRRRLTINVAMRLAIEVFRDDQQWPACLGNLIKQRDKVSQRTNLMVAQQNGGILEN